MSERPRLLDLFCGAGGATCGYQMAGFHVTGVDIEPQPRHCGDAFVQADALEYVAEHGGEYDAIHASPPCQGYSVMRNLPWFKDREYPLLILPTRILLERVGRPYVIENVMGARWGNRQLARRGLGAHGMKAAYLCGLMFGLPFYRHRLFETSHFWLQPGHPRHRATRATGAAASVPEARPRGRYGGGGWSRPRIQGNLAAPPSYPARKRLEDLPDGNGRLFQDAKGSWRRQRPMNGGLAARQQGGNGAQEHACGVAHAAGWRDFAAIAGIDWMTREEVCQSIPPAYTLYIGTQLRNWL